MRTLEKPFIIAFAENAIFDRIEISVSGILTFYGRTLYAPEFMHLVGLFLLGANQDCFQLRTTGTFAFLNNQQSYNFIYANDSLHSQLALHTHNASTSRELHSHVFSGGPIDPSELRCFMGILEKLAKISTQTLIRLFPANPAVLYEKKLVDPKNIPRLQEGQSCEMFREFPRLRNNCVYATDTPNMELPFTPTASVDKIASQFQRYLNVTQQAAFYEGFQIPDQSYILLSCMLLGFLTQVLNRFMTCYGMEKSHVNELISAAIVLISMLRNEISLSFMVLSLALVVVQKERAKNMLQVILIAYVFTNGFQTGAVQAAKSTVGFNVGKKVANVFCNRLFNHQPAREEQAPPRQDAIFLALP